jgi:gluconolactonase
MPSRIAGAPPADTFNNNGNDFTVVEGPVWITNALYISEFGSKTKPPPSRILKIDASDSVTVAFPSVTDTGSNGLAVDARGNIVSANHGVGGIVSLPLPTGSPATTLTSMFMGVRFDSPNDLTIRSDGAIYFTDFAGDQAPSPAPQSSARVYLLPAGAKNAAALFADTNNPNGIALSLDEQSLYVGDGSGVKKYAVSADGTVGASGTVVDATDLSNQNTDGMAVDCAGNLYVVRVNAHDIVIVSPAGQKLANISVPGSGQITNAAFGGSDHKTLYITVLGSGTTRGVFKLAMPLPGMPF